MRCKKNDVAVIIGGRTGKHVGMEVTCLSYLGAPEFHSEHKDLWRIDKDITWTDGISRPYISDSILMPIKPRGEDLKAFVEEADKIEKEKSNEVSV